MLLAFLLFSLPIVIQQAAAVPITKMSVVPTQNSWTEPTKTIGSTFTVDINVYNATGLRAWQVGVAWDTKILDFVSYTWGNFRNYAGFTLRIDPTINETLGKWATPASETWATGGVDGGVTTQVVTLLTLTFNFTAYGTSPLTIIDAVVVDWADVTYTPPAFALEQGTAQLVPAPNVAPIADFTIDVAVPTAGQIANFTDVSIDPDGTIVNATWSWSDGTPDTVVIYPDGKTVGHVFAVAGTYRVTLTVWDNGKPPFYPALWTLTYKDIGVLASFAFNVGGHVYKLTVLTNTTISTPILDETQQTVSFNVTGTGTGYANVTIPESFMQGPWTVLVDNSDPSTLDIKSNGTHTFIYLTFTLSTRTIKITAGWMVPEFPTALIPQILIILIATTTAAIISKRTKQSKTRPSESPKSFFCTGCCVNFS